MENEEINFDEFIAASSDEGYQTGSEEAEVTEEATETGNSSPDGDSSQQSEEEPENEERDGGEKTEYKATNRLRRKRSQFVIKSDICYRPSGTAPHASDSANSPSTVRIAFIACDNVGDQPSSTTRTLLYLSSPVPAGMSLPMMTFSFKPISWSSLPLIAASVRTFVVSWNEAAERKDSVARADFVIPRSTGETVIGVTSLPAALSSSYLFS